MKFRSRKKIGFLGLTLFSWIMSSTISAAHAAPVPPNSPFDLQKLDIQKVEDAWTRLREATETIESMPAIQALLSEPETHSILMAQRISSAALETTKFQHYYKGLEVIGSMAFHHHGANGTSIRNNIVSFDLDTAPSLSVEAASAIAQSVAGDRPLSKIPELKILPSSQDNHAKLTYWVELDESGMSGARKVIVDAHDGHVIGNISENMTIAPINIYSAKNRGIVITPFGDSEKQILQGCNILDLATKQIQKIDAKTCQQVGSDQCQVILDGDPIDVKPQFCAQTVSTSPQVLNNSTSTPEVSSQRAANNSSKVLTYYLSTHNRNSYDDQGSTVVSIVHAGMGYDNAHWNIRSNRMVYGDGDGVRLGDFTLALDVAGHEMTHGVTAATAKLLGMGESGALNEAYSDFFGKMIDYNGDWAIGRKLFLKPSEAKGVRNLADPHQITNGFNGKPSPAIYSERLLDQATCDDSNDSCWVHINATIPGHAGYLVVQAIGKEKAEKLYYTVLTHGLSANDNIKSAAQETLSICKHMYDAMICKQVEQAFSQVGL